MHAALMEGEGKEAFTHLRNRLRQGECHLYSLLSSLLMIQGPSRVPSTLGFWFSYYLW